VTKVHVGDVWVDAGAIWVGDPCYVIGTDSNYGQMTWKEFCDKWFAHDKSGTLKNSDHAGVSEVLGTGIGMAIDTTWGDGSYPVYVEYHENGRPERVTIEFNEVFEGEE
jgi:hypothetical protein